MFQILTPLTIAAALGVLCTILHLAGLLAMNHAIRIEHREEMVSDEGKLSVRGLTFTATLFMALFVLHSAEILAFTVAYFWLGALPDFESALYFSTISYSTVGYEDVHILKEWRLIGAVESVVGILLIGWSTAYSLRLLGRLEG